MSLWTEDEKRTLLFALQQHGPSDIKVLQMYLPNKTTIEIQLLCEKHTELALKKQTEKRDSQPIRAWHPILKRLKAVHVLQATDIVPRVLKYIALFEKREPSNTVDLKAIYMSLYQMSMGLNPDKLDRNSDYYLYECLNKLANCLKYKGGVRHYKKHLASLLNLKDLQKHRINNDKLESSLILNPLGIPKNLLQMHKDDK